MPVELIKTIKPNPESFSSRLQFGKPDGQVMRQRNRSARIYPRSEFVKRWLRCHDQGRGLSLWQQHVAADVGKSEIGSDDYNNDRANAAAGKKVRLKHDNRTPPARA